MGLELLFWAQCLRHSERLCAAGCILGRWCVCVSVHTHTHGHIHTLVHTRRTHTPNRCSHTHTHTHAHTHTHTHTEHMHTHKQTRRHHGRRNQGGWRGRVPYNFQDRRICPTQKLDRKISDAFILKAQHSVLSPAP